MAMPTLEEKVAFLSTVAAYGGRTRCVKTIETHMAWVFLTDTLVYKLKKPVKYAYLDFSTVKKRQRTCEDEVRLNRRLAPQTYRTIQPLCLDRTKQLSVDGRGKVVDWLVVMNRLPQNAAMDERIVHRRLAVEDVRHIGDTLGCFYAFKAARVSTGQAYPEHLEQEHEVTRQLLLAPRFKLSDKVAVSLLRFEQALPLLRPEIENRIHSGCVVEGHGDLRPEHVFLVRPLQIIDCLEFNRAMRILDPFDEVNYLGLECGILGADWVRPLLLEVLHSYLGNPPSSKLLSFYGVFRALLRARICLQHLLETPVRESEVWRPLATRYLDFAANECLSLPSPRDAKPALPLSAR